MLVLTRKTGETIHIGDDIVLKVSEVSGNRVKICIDAPQTLRILRGEVADKMELSSVEDSTVRQKASRRELAESHMNINSIAR